MKNTVLFIVLILISAVLFSCAETPDYVRAVRQTEIQNIAARTEPGTTAAAATAPAQPVSAPALLTVPTEERNAADSYESDGTGAPESLTSAQAETTQQLAPASNASGRFVLYWTQSGARKHINPNCGSLRSGAISGTLEQANAISRITGWCGTCSRDWTDERFLAEGNPFA